MQQFTISAENVKRLQALDYTCSTVFSPSPADRMPAHVPSVISHQTRHIYVNLDAPGDPQGALSAALDSLERRAQCEELVEQVQGYGYKVVWTDLPSNPQLIPCAVVVPRKVALFNNRLDDAGKVEALRFALGAIQQPQAATGPHDCLN